MLESWPVYDMELVAAPAEGCVQDRTEGGGNGEFERATPLEVPLAAVLCPEEADIYLWNVLWEEPAEPLYLAPVDGPVHASLVFYPEQETIAEAVVVPGEPANLTMMLQTDPDERDVFVVVRITEEAPAEGIVYELFAD